MKKLSIIAAVTGAAVLSFLSAFPSFAAGWRQNETGYWYEREDKSYPAGTWELIDGRWYLFDQMGYMLTGWQQTGGTWYYLGTDGAMMEQADHRPVMGRFEGSVFINDWSGIRLTMPQGFVNLDSQALSGLSDSDTVLDMLSMKNETCCAMVIYTANKDGDIVSQASSFLNRFQGGSLSIEGGMAVETVQAGELSYLRFYFPSTEQSPLSCCMYVRNVENYYAVIVTVFDEAGAPDIQAVLSSLSQAQ